MTTGEPDRLRGYEDQAPISDPDEASPESRGSTPSPRLKAQNGHAGDVTHAAIEPIIEVLRASSFGQQSLLRSAVNHRLIDFGKGVVGRSSRANSSGSQGSRPIDPSQLPFEIIFGMFHYLDSKDLLATLNTCRSWCVCSVDLLWHRPKIETPFALARLINTLNLKSPSFTYPAFIRRLSLSSVHGHVTDAVIAKFSACSRLERITVVGCSRVTDTSLIQVIEANPNLFALDLSGLLLITDMLLKCIAKSSLLLTGINLAGCIEVTDEGILALAKSCTSLRRVKLTNCTLVTDVGIRKIIDSCPWLLELDINNINHITDNAIETFPQTVPCLRELRMASCTLVTGRGFSSPFQASALRVLDITGCAAINDDALGLITRMAPRIRNLVISRCHQVTDYGVIHIASLRRYLHYLHLGHCEQFTDAAIVVLCKYCTRLRYLDLACISLLTDVSVIEISQLPKIRRIGLVKCQNLTDLAVFALVSRKIMDSHFISPLERVHLSFCVNLTLHGIMELLNSSPRLTHLSLTGIPTFLRDDLRHYSRPPPSEFSTHQSSIFCVFSGAGVAKLRGQLNYMANQARALELQNHAGQEGEVESFHDALALDHMHRAWSKMEEAHTNTVYGRRSALALLADRMLGGGSSGGDLQLSHMHQSPINSEPVYVASMVSTVQPQESTPVVVEQPIPTSSRPTTATLHQNGDDGTDDEDEDEEGLDD